MKKKIVKIVSLIFLMILVGTSTVFANELHKEDVETGKKVSQIVEPRSRYLAAAISEITNKGNGVLHIYVDFTSNSSVDWAKLTINLERSKSGEAGTWSNIKTYTYEFNVEDESNGRLTYGYADFDVSGYATGYYYRLRCEHKVKTPSGSYETKNTQTDGVLLTSYPDFRSIDETN